MEEKNKVLRIIICNGIIVNTDYWSSQFQLKQQRGMFAWLYFGEWYRYTYA